jgi:hypothetical protein
MKRFLACLLTIVCMGVAGLSLAATPKVSTKSPNAQQIDLRLRNQWQSTLAAFKAGKITEAQKDSIRTSLRSVRVKEFNYFKTNKNHELTPTQQGQLNQGMNSNSSTIGEKPVS